jgi:hypothetical protein
LSFVNGGAGNLSINILSDVLGSGVTDGTIVSSSEGVSFQFFDKGDSVPDNSSTLGMMALSAAAMFGFSRFQRARA